MSIDNIFNLIGLSTLVAVACLAIVLINKLEQIKKLRASLNKLKRAFDELDEQAKLIVKTDLELNKTQEELDKKVFGLYSLQKISQLISTSLDEQEMFNRIKEPLVEELGFDRGFICIIDKNNDFSWKMNLGYAPEELNRFKIFIATDKICSEVIKAGQTLSSNNLPETNYNKISTMFNVSHFIICPLLTQDGVIGLVFIGNKSKSNPLTEGDEELMSIFATQLGQSIENARLFEEVFRSRQDLELKIKERTKELADVLEEVKRISKMKSDFISAVSHELRTPLTSIKGYASILMSGTMGQIPEAVQERLHKINQHSDNLVKLINDLLDISRIESGKVAMKTEPLKLNKIVDAIADMLGPQLKEKQIDLSINVPESLPFALADSSQIERVFINLVSNAIKFTPEHGKVTIHAKDNADSLEITVSDSGIGINPKDLEHIFEEFYRVDNPVNEKIKGTGLGLTLVKQIIEAHKGKIWAASRPNEGSAFSFTLPKQK